MIFQSLINNAAILLTLCFLYTLVSRYWRDNDLTAQIIRGLLFGLVAIGVMLSPLHLAAGLVFDTRTVVIGIAGLFGGPLTVAIAAALAIAYRILLGGVGVAPGIATVLAAAVIGVLFFAWRREWRRPTNALCFYFFGLAVHVAMLLCLFTLPRELAWQTISSIALPVLVIHPLATLLLALLMADLEGRAAMERRLQESEERFRALFEQAGDAIFVADFDGRLLDVNAAAQTGLGYSRAELLRLRIQDVDPQAPDHDVLQEFWRRHFDVGRAVTFESVHRRKDGSTFPVEIRAGFISQARRRLVLGLARDITERVQAAAERRRLEGHLLQAQKMEAVGTLAGGIAHEFNNILTTIVGYAELALLLHDRDRSSQPEYLQEILNSSKRAADLVKRILTFSRKAEATAFRVFDLNKELEHAITILEKTIPREIRIAREFSPEGVFIRGDAGQLEQIMLNLGTNAKDAMPAGGTLTIKTERVTIGAEGPAPFAEMPAGEYVCLRVGDTGHGMAPETMKAIFNPFFTTKEVGSGTGLGLAMVYGIVQGHQGFIRCLSEPGQGATFEIYLPLTAPAGSGQEGPDAPPPDLAADPQGVTILQVDDEAALLEIGRLMLEGAGYQTRQADSGEKALELLEQQGEAIDLVLLDVSMPGMGGRRCLEKILERRPTARVLITSGYARDASVQEILALGATGFVAKPFHRTDMLAAVRQALRS
jgi:PAS domain S-box-containing protein